MNSEFEVYGFVSDWKDKHNSPLEAYTDMVNRQVEDNPTLKQQAKEQYKEGYSIQDIILNGRKLRFFIFENGEFIHPDENEKIHHPEKYREYLNDENYKYQTKERLIDVSFKKRKNHFTEFFMRRYLNLTNLFNGFVSKFQRSTNKKGKEIN